MNLICNSVDASWQELCAIMEGVALIYQKKSIYVVLKVRDNFLDLALKLQRDLDIEVCLDVLGLNDDQYEWSANIECHELLRQLSLFNVCIVKDNWIVE